MADITMCVGTDCPMKNNCYRHTANANEYRQYYFIDVPLKEDKSCDEFWDDERHKTIRRTK
jgi:hypothetical protein